jgi:hypothetical protein
MMPQASFTLFEEEQEEVAQTRKVSLVGNKNKED